jgi:RNA polymerase sigma-70 factor (ECF subfamily)
MPSEPLPAVVACIRRIARPADDAPDADLLERFVSNRDEAAFAVLVRRHGPMVLGVCRRITGNAADAEDACQAVFLIFVQKAAAIRPQVALAGWLHAVARNVSRRAVRAAARRRRHEEEAVRPVLAGPNPELRDLIDREIGRLPADYRAAVVLCDLEGLTRSEAAGRLGWADGTVASRLARGRQLLAKRLVRVGLGLAGVSLPALPSAFAETIVRIGTAGTIVASPAALALTHGALRAMSLKRFTLFAAVGLAIAGVGLTVRQTLPPAAAHVSIGPAIATLPRSVPVKADDGISVRTVPPVVVKTVPTAGAADVDPATTEIKVTFSKDMTDKSWSWSSLSDDTFPKTAGDDPIHYEKDKRTCVLKVKLEAGKTYAVWVNSEKFANFKDADGRPAVPYLLVFQTKKAD